MKRRIVLSILLIFIGTLQGFAQCAMCKTTIVNNVSHGELSLAEGLNFGILYLFFTPYLAIAVVAFFWYQSSRRNAKLKQSRRHVGV